MVWSSIPSNEKWHGWSSSEEAFPDGEIIGKNWQAQTFSVIVDMTMTNGWPGCVYSVILVQGELVMMIIGCMGGYKIHDQHRTSIIDGYTDRRVSIGHYPSFVPDRISKETSVNKSSTWYSHPHRNIECNLSTTKPYPLIVIQRLLMLNVSHLPHQTISEKTPFPPNWLYSDINNNPTWKIPMKHVVENIKKSIYST